MPVLPTLGALAVSAYASSIAGVSLAVAAVVAEPTSPWPSPTLPEVGAIAYLAVIATAMAFLGWYVGVARLGVERAGLLAGLIPVAALLSGAVLGEGALTWPKALGVALVAAGISLGLAPRGRALASATPCVEPEPLACANGD